MNRWIFSTFSQTAEGLAIYRIAYALALLFVWPSPSLRPLGELPDGFFCPPLGPFMLLSRFPSPDLLTALELANQFGLVFLLIGLYTRQTSWLVGLLQLFLCGVRFSSGKIDHDLLIMAVPLLMSFTSWGHAFSADGFREKVRQAPGFREPATSQLTYFALLLGFTFFTSGIMKALTGWANPSASATRGYLYVYLHHYEWAANDFNRWLAGIHPFAFWKALDYLTLAFEMGFLLSVVSQRAFSAFLLAAIGFHVGVMLMLSIDFSKLLLVYMVFTDLGRLGQHRWVARGLEAFGRFFSRGAWVKGATACAAYVACTRLWGPLALPRLFTRPMPLSFGFLLLCGTLVLATGSVLLRPRRRSEAPAPSGAAP